MCAAFLKLTPGQSLSQPRPPPPPPPRLNLPCPALHCTSLPCPALHCTSLPFPAQFRFSYFASSCIFLFPPAYPSLPILSFSTNVLPCLHLPCTVPPCPTLLSLVCFSLFRLLFSGLTLPTYRCLSMSLLSHLNIISSLRFTLPCHLHRRSALPCFSLPYLGLTSFLVPVFTQITLSCSTLNCPSLPGTEISRLNMIPLSYSVQPRNTLPYNPRSHFTCLLLPPTSNTLTFPLVLLPPCTKLSSFVFLGFLSPSPFVLFILIISVGLFTVLSHLLYHPLSLLLLFRGLNSVYLSQSLHNSLIIHLLFLFFFYFVY